MNTIDLKKKIIRINTLMCHKILYRFDSLGEINFVVDPNSRPGWKEFTPDMLTDEGVEAAKVAIVEKEIDGVARHEFQAMYQSILLAGGKE